MKDTGLKDSEGTPIKDGDDILWTYDSCGVEITGEDGIKQFMGCYPAVKIRTLTYIQVMKYEVRENSAGYFLDIPNMIGTTGLKDKIKCTVIKK